MSALSVLKTTPDCVERCVLACACAPSRDAICLHVRRFYAEKSMLCDELEAIADSLPSRLDRLKCLDLASRLIPLLRAAHLYEEELIFPAFVEGSGSASAAGTVLRLKSEHLYDEGCAEELTEELMRIGHGGRIDNAEALGFMLRAFFGTVRRHIAFEIDHVLASARPGSIAGDG